MSESTEPFPSDLSEAADQGQQAVHAGTERVKEVLEQGKTYVAANPVPIIAGAFVAGILIGFLIPKEQEAPASRLNGHIDELKDLLSNLGSKVSSSAEGSYDDVSSVLGDVLSRAKKRLNLF
ncbi:MAG TPA: hypothetical protein VF585_01565 [Chthoniobacterales bacterium]